MKTPENCWHAGKSILHPLLTWTLLFFPLAALATDVTIVPAGSVWKYNANGTDLGTAWRAPAYDDSSWLGGPAKIGYGDTDDVTVVPRTSPVYPCYYFRHHFTVSDPARFNSLSLEILRDDGCVAYLNGQEVLRYGLPAGTITFNTWALTASEYPWDPPVAIPNLLVPGENVLAVEIHQCNTTSTDIALDLRLTGKSSVTALLNEPADLATSVAVPSTLSATATSPVGANLDVGFYGRPTPAAGPDFTLVVLPDIQKYTAEVGGNRQILFSQADWIASNRQALNIAYVVQEGDVSDTGDMDTDESEWSIAADAFSRLRNAVSPDGIPYGLAVGNHDQYVLSGDTVPTTLYNKYFGIGHFAGKSYFGGTFSPSNANNQFQVFGAGGLDFIVIYLEYNVSPDPAVLAWANNLLAANATRRGIVVSHYLLDTTAAWGAQGLAIYNALKGNPNLFLMLCGHNHGEARRTDVYNGNTVHTLLADYQDYLNGGNGLLRILTFSPANNQIRVQTYSPWLGQSEVDANSEFTLNVPLGPDVPFTLIQQNADVPSGTTSTACWGGLQPGTMYDWYAVATDGTDTGSSELRTFTTIAGPPAAPTGLASQAGDGRVVLNWNVAVGATAYNVKRSTTAGGPYGFVASVLEPATFTDIAVQNGSTYYYVVSGVNAAGEGPDSAEVAATPRTYTAPVASSDDYAATEDSLLVVSAGVLANDSDADGDALIAVLVSGPSHGTLSLDTDGSFTYRPEANFNGPDTFTYKATDGVLESVTALVTINVAAENDLPIASPDSASTFQNTSVLINVLANDSEPDGDALSITITGTPTGTANLNLDNTITYTPSTDFIGTDSFSYTLSDGLGGSASTTVIITVAAPVTPPVAPSKLVARPSSNSEISLSWSDNSTDETGFVVERSADGSSWSVVGTLPPNSTSMNDVGLTSGTLYQYQVLAEKDEKRSDPSNRASAAPFIDDYATQESLAFGTLTSGSRLNTISADGTYEQLTEKISGSKNAKTSALEQKWVFTVTAGKSHLFLLKAYHSASADLEDFVFAWSSDGVIYQDMLVLQATSPEDYVSFALPAGISGTVYIRVLDTDRTIGRTSLDSLYIDHMAIRTDISPSLASPASPTLGEAIAGDGCVTLNWTSSADAACYSVWRSVALSGYTLRAESLSTTSFKDTGLENGVTYWYVVTAVNGFGSSEFSNELSAIPQAAQLPAPPADLTATGSRKKITLNWAQSSSPGITQNLIYRLESGGYTLHATIAASTTWSEAVPSGASFYYCVKAVNAGGASDFSNTASATAK